MSNQEYPNTEYLEKYLNKLPELLQSQVKQQLKNIVETIDSTDIPSNLIADIPKVLACSEFVARWVQREPGQFKQLLDSDDLQRQYNATTYSDKLQVELDNINDRQTLNKTLRQHRQREMVRIAWRDITGKADLQETLRDLSNLADASIQTALAKLHNWLIYELGQPINSTGVAQELIVIALGKLGGQELNFSSDVDLMFVYPEEGETTGNNKKLSNSEFFIRLGQQLISILDETTADGFVFRVDMRLRPFGQSGALAVNFDSLENYYQTHGREWERYALVKARFLTGEESAKNQLREILRPFIYRRYLDFNVYESLRNMKQLIINEVERKNIDHNVKLGAGGIREIEFISQTYQLIRGGREPALQNSHLLPTLDQLTQFNYLPDYVTDELKQAYQFLRNTEHRLQEFADQQTHTIPEEPIARLRLAYSMNFTDWDLFVLELDKQRQRVRSHFDQVFLAPQTQTNKSTQLDLSNIWEILANDLSTELSTEEVSLKLISSAGYLDPKAALRELNSFLQSYQYRSLGSNGRKLLNQLMPLLVAAIGQHSNPDKTLQRIISLLGKIAQRTTYIALLLENPMALSQLVKLCAASHWIANLLSKHPLLLDELLDPRFLYAPPDKSTLGVELEKYISRVPVNDLEMQMEIFRQFKQVNVLRVAAADIVDALPLMKVSDHLTWIAETILKQILNIAWHDLITKHGSPACQTKGQPASSGFAIIAYGKLGGIELGYGSDLDLVFLHSGPDIQTLTTGLKPITSAVFFTRLGQRIIHMINTHTPSGVLYDVDMRLRPSGSSGLLVSHIDAFSDYQLNKAWTWEHQALVRARAVAGGPQVALAFADVRKNTLSQKFDTEKLKFDVKDMRERMRKSNETRSKKSAMQLFDIKQGRGGIADIEFMVQYGVLAWSHDHPELLEFSDNIRLLECFDKIRRLSTKDVSVLADAYRHYRNTVHKLTLLGNPAVVDSAKFDNFRQQVIRIWNDLLGDSS